MADKESTMRISSNTECGMGDISLAGYIITPPWLMKISRLIVKYWGLPFRGKSPTHIKPWEGI